MPARNIGDGIGRKPLGENRDEQEDPGQDQADKGGKRHLHFGCLKRGLARMPMMSAAMFRKM